MNLLISIVCDKKGCFNMKLTIKESDDFKKSKKQSKRLSEKKALKEGPGAGYTIKTKGLSDLVINSAEVVNKDGYYIEVKVDATATIDEMYADSYYYGTGKMENIPVRIDSAYVDEYDLGTIDETDEETLKILVKDTLYDNASDTEYVYGGGWMHSHYNGEVGNGESDMWHGFITDQEAIDYIDTAVQGENYSESYRVTDESDDVIDSFYTEEEAVAFAKEELKTGAYETLTVELVRDWYDYSGDYIETWENPEVVWQGEYEYDDDYEVDEYED